MLPVHNTLSEEIRAQTVELLNRRLAAANDLQGQLRQAQGNVSGSAFIAVHPLSDKVAGEAENCSDLIAEPAAGLGGIADGAVQVAAERSFLIPYPSRIAEENQHTFTVAATLSAFGRSGRGAIGQSETIGCADTADLFRRIVCG
jgi:starvation-inducible DNA-binding protein